MSDPIVIRCARCGLLPLDKPFKFGADNKWLDGELMHAGCSKEAEVEAAAKRGFGVDPAKDNTDKTTPVDYNI